jgi:GxxExxY protein
MDERVERAARAVIGAAIEVHRILGPGYLESVYEEALAAELEIRGIPFQRQVVFSLDYKGRAVGTSRLDLLVDGCLVVELKAVEMIAEIHVAQAISYLKATSHRLALIINFNMPRLVDGVKRVAL